MNNQMASFAVQESHRGWQAMLQLVDTVGRGGSIPPIAPSIMLRPGEVQHGGPFAMDCFVFCSADVEYAQGYSVSGGLLFTAVGMAIGEANLARARRQAIAYAQPQWRPAGQMPLFLTNSRLLILAEGRWKSYELEQMITMTTQIPAYTLDLHYEAENPIRVMGPWVPWLAVAISALYNPRQWPPYFLTGHVPQALLAPRGIEGATQKALPAPPFLETDTQHGMS